MMIILFVHFPLTVINNMILKLSNETNTTKNLSDITR